MNRKERYAGILDWFGRNMPDVKTELDYDTPFHLLVAVILSAQCTDRRVNMHTPDIFRKYPVPQALAEADEAEVREDIKSITYPNSKAKQLTGMARMLVSEFGGEVPEDPEDLVRLPGVGRKTANVIASIVYGKPVIAVDTHVFRVARRLGLSDGKTVEAVEKDLTANISPELRPRAHHWLILHGRYVCKAVRPDCGNCQIREWCRYLKEQGTTTNRDRK